MNDVPMYLGWAGMVLLLTGYALDKRARPTPLFLLNFGGAVLICVYCYAGEAWPPFVLNVFWAGVAVCKRFWKRPTPA